jgi:AcrR family transcriptional regulator
VTKSMKTRKLELVRETIYDKAMELFAREGFNETTMEQIADASGVSLRTVFRYFPTKNDLFGYALGAYAEALIAAMSSAPPELAAFDLVRQTSLAGVNFAISQPRLRVVMDITRRNHAARQAFATGLVDVENRLAETFALRMKRAGEAGFQPRMLALLSQMAISLTLNSWIDGEFKDPSAAHRNVYSELLRLCLEESSHADPDPPARRRKRASAASLKG